MILPDIHISISLRIVLFLSYIIFSFFIVQAVFTNANGQSENLVESTIIFKGEKISPNHSLTDFAQQIRNRVELSKEEQSGWPRKL